MYIHRRIIEDVKQIFKYGGFNIFDEDITIFSERSGIDIGVACHRLTKHGGFTTQEIAMRTRFDSTTGMYPFHPVEVVDGYINYRLNDKYLIDYVSTEMSCNEEEYGRMDKHGTIIVEYCSPNTGKLFSLGHLRGTVVGDSLARILGFSHTDVGSNIYFGDYSHRLMKVAMCCDKNQDQELTMDLVNEYYIAADELDISDDDVTSNCKKLDDLICSGKYDNTDVYNIICKVNTLSINYIIHVLDVIGTRKMYSEYELLIIPEARNLIPYIPIKCELTEMIYHTTEPKFIVKNGLTTYFSRDVASLIKRYRSEWHVPDRILYVVGSEQKGHFKDVFEFAGICGVPRDVPYHVEIGLITVNGKKMTSKDGNVVTFQEALDVMLKKLEDYDISDDDKMILAVGILKYICLKSSRDKTLKLDFDKLLEMDISKLAYLQYTAVRANSIVTKANDCISLQIDSIGDKEREILMCLTEFPLAVERAADRLMPHILVNYLDKLAKVFNAYYNSTQILSGDEHEITRVWLTTYVAVILTKGLELLGIGVPSKM